MTVLSEPSAATQYLSFRLAGDEYAVNILRVREIIEYPELTRVPGTPPSIRGVINLRGHVVPVIDLVVRFGQPPSEITRWSCIVIVDMELDGQSTKMGILADSVSEVVDLRGDDIEPPPAFGTAVHVEYLVGMGKSGNKFILLLNMDRLLGAKEIDGLRQLGTDDNPGDVPDDTTGDVSE